MRDKLFIGGEWVAPAGDGTIDVVNPTTEEVIGRIPEGPPEDAGRRCPGTRNYRKRDASGDVRVRSFENKALPIGATIEIRVTKADMIGALKTLTVRKRKKPSLATRCLAPGATAPTRC